MRGLAGVVNLRNTIERHCCARCHSERPVQGRKESASEFALAVQVFRFASSGTASAVRPKAAFAEALRLSASFRATGTKAKHLNPPRDVTGRFFRPLKQGLRMTAR